MSLSYNLHDDDLEESMPSCPTPGPVSSDAVIDKTAWDVQCQDGTPSCRSFWNFVRQRADTIAAARD